MTDDRATTDDIDYLLGTDPAEVARLGFQHRVWAEHTHRLWRRARFGPRQAIADLGAGPGFASVDLALLVGDEGNVVAVDESRRFIDHIEQEAARLGLNQLLTRRSDLARLELPDASLDGAFARWVLCFLSHPEGVLRRVHAALRPGGRFAIIDYFNYLATSFSPEGPALTRVLRAVAQSYERSKGNLEVGRELPVWLERSGFSVTHLDVVAELARPGDVFWEWPKQFLFGFLSTLMDHGLLSHDDARAFELEWREREQTPGAFFMTPPMLMLVAEKR